MSVFSFLKKSKNLNPDLGHLKVDVHSHLIPAIDDGVQSTEESLTVLKEMEVLGYRKVITTPHTMSGTFDNTPEIIYTGLEKMRQAIATENINIRLEAATEYFLDEVFMEKVNSGQDKVTRANSFANKSIVKSLKFEKPNKI